MVHELNREEKHFVFSRSVTPAVEVDSGDYVLFNTTDAHNGSVDVSTAFRDVRFPELTDNGNPVNGFVAVRGAKKGDTIRVRVLSIEPSAVGFLPVRGYMGIVRDVVDDTSARIVEFKDGRIYVTPDFSLPANPMVGTIGLAPSDEEVSSTLPGAHGGNLDNKHIRSGSEVLLPVCQDGGLLGVGDVHAAMGDGELTCGGVDICARVLVRVESIPAGLTTTNPVVTDGDWVFTHGIGKSYEEAAKEAIEDMVRLLTLRTGLSRYESIVALGVRGEVGICQACTSADFPMVLRCGFPKDLIGGVVSDER